MSDAFRNSSTLENGEGPSRSNTFELEDLDVNDNPNIPVDNATCPITNAATPLENQYGPIGLAGSKTYDVRFSLYHYFPEEASRCLDERVFDLQRLIAEGRKIEEKVETKHHTRPTLLPYKNKYRRRYQRVRRKIDRKIFSYYEAMLTVHNVSSLPRPSKYAFQGLKWLSAKRYSEYFEIIDNKELDDFKLVGPKRSNIEEAIKGFPQTKIGNKLFRFLRMKTAEVTDLKIQKYGDEHLSIVVGVVVQIGFALFFIVPPSLITYHAVGWTVGVSIIIGLCVLMCLLAAQMSDREEVKVLIVSAYAAIMAAFISPSRSVVEFGTGRGTVGDRREEDALVILLYCRRRT